MKNVLFGAFLFLISSLGTAHGAGTPGTLNWLYTTGSLIISSPAVGADGTVYVGSNDDKLYAVNPDGTLKWSYATGAPIYSSPAVGADGTVYVGSEDNKLYAINPNGTLKWSYAAVYEIWSSPAIGADGTIYVASYDDKLYAVNPNGTLKWSYATGNGIYWSSPAIGADGTVYVGSTDEKLYAVNPDGTLKWSYSTGLPIHSSPAIGTDGTIYVGAYLNNLYALNPDGTFKWSYATVGGPYATGNLVWSSPAIGADGTVYVGSSDSNIYAIYSSSLGLASSPWPMFHQNLLHTGLATSTLVPRTATLSLSSGWNLVSLPLQQPASTAIASVLSGVEGALDVVWAYPDQEWKVYDPNDAAGSTLTTMQAGMGYWIKMTGPKTLSVSGSAPSSSLPLVSGWNLVGYNGTSCEAASTALSSTSFGNPPGLQFFSWGYSGSVWQSYDPTKPAQDSALTQLCPRAGYWINVNQAATWTP